jgi:hypothetical protein
MVEAVNHPGVKLLLKELHEESERMTEAQINIDPYNEPEKIMKAQMFRFIVDTVLPQKIEAFVNFDAESPDKKVAPKWRWKITEWFNPR